jgi:acetyltransferase
VDPAPRGDALSAPRVSAETVELRDGSRVRLRPIEPGDEKLLQGLLDHMSLEDIRLRFFAPLRHLGAALAHQLSNPDPLRDIALAALPLAGEEILGVGRLAADSALRRAEYALAVRTDMKGHGLGFILLTRLLDYARARGIAEIWGDVLRENEAMLRMCRELGFAVSDHPDEAHLYRVTRRL